MNPINRMLRTAFKAHAFAVAVCLLFAARPMAAEEFTVNTTVDSGDGSLRQEVTDSNGATDVSNNIIFDTGAIAADAQFTLSNGALPDIEQTLTIDGTDPGGLEIIGDGTNLVTIKSNGRLTLKDVDFSNGEILIEGNGILTFDVTGDPIEIDGVIADAPLNTGGTLTKTGSGSLVLTGANTFTGGVTVSDGTLEVSTDSIGTTTTIRTNAALLFSQSTSGSYNGIILGTGTLEKEGTGTVTLTGANTYSGGTTITAGTLSGEPGPIQGDVAIASGATLEIVDDAGSTYTDTISGAGTLVKSGAATLVLAPTSGANSWSEGRVSNGALMGDAAAISGNVDISFGASLMIDQAGSGTLGGNLSGAGQFVKLGTGNLTLIGNNAGLTSTATNAIMVSAGGLIGNTSSLPTNVLVQSGTSLTFNQSSAGTYSEVISGAGDFIKTGSGTLTLDSMQTFFGSTTINAGRLDFLSGGGLSGTSGTTVASGATLGGTGSIIGDVMNSGRIAPGTSTGSTGSTGTLQVDGITFLPGSVLEIEVDPTPASDQLDVTNLADLSDGALELNVAGGTYTNASFTIISAGSRSGSLAFTDDFPLLDISLQTMGNNLVLEINSNGASIATIASTANQRAVGLALDLETGSAGADLISVIDAFATLRTPEFSTALDSLSGETLTQFATARFEHADRFDLALHSRLRDASDTLDQSLRGRGRRRSPFRGLPGVGAANSRPITPQIDLWFEPFAVFAGIDGHQGESDVDLTLFGVTAGAETHPFPSAANELRNIRVGAAFAYGRSELKFDDRDGSGSSDSYMGALYGGWSNDRFRAGLSGRLAYSDMDSERRIAVGTLVRDAKADFDGLDLGTRLEVAGKWLTNESLILESFGSIDYAHLQRSSIRESGAASINLRIDREKLDTFRVGFGTRLVALVVIDPDTWMLPELRAQWVHQLLDRDRVIDASFAGATTSSEFQIRGADLQRNSASVGVGWTVRARSGFEAALNYDLGIDTDRLAHAIGLRIGTHW